MRALPVRSVRRRRTRPRWQRRERRRGSSAWGRRGAESTLQRGPGSSRRRKARNAPAWREVLLTGFEVPIAHPERKSDPRLRGPATLRYGWAHASVEPRIVAVLRRGCAVFAKGGSPAHHEREDKRMKRITIAAVATTFAGIALNAGAAAPLPSNSNRALL